MKIALSVGHSILKSGAITSADGLINEYKYCKSLAPQVKTYLEQLGAKVTLIQCPEKKFVRATEERAYKLDIINKGGFDLLVELHLNAFNQESAHGTEVYYYSNNGKIVADRVQKKLITKFKDRGTQKKTNLYILKSTKPPSILIELFFCTNKNDVKISKDEDMMARLVAEGIMGKDISKPVVGKDPKGPISAASKKADIKWLQKKLNIALKGKFSIVEDGSYGPNTRIAVLIFWEMKKLGRHMKDDGTVAGTTTIVELAKYK